MRLLILAAMAAVVLPTASWSAVPGSKDRTATVRAPGKIQTADYYRNGKHCRRVGSATVCN